MSETMTASERAMIEQAISEDGTVDGRVFGLLPFYSWELDPALQALVDADTAALDRPEDGETT